MVVVTKDRPTQPRLLATLKDIISLTFAILAILAHQVVEFSAATQPATTPYDLFSVEMKFNNLSSLI